MISLESIQAVEAVELKNLSVDHGTFDGIGLYSICSYLLKKYIFNKLQSSDKNGLKITLNCHFSRYKGRSSIA